MTWFEEYDDALGLEPPSFRCDNCGAWVEEDPRVAGWLCDPCARYESRWPEQDDMEDEL